MVYRNGVRGGSVHTSDDHGVEGFYIHHAEIDFTIFVMGLEGNRAIAKLTVRSVEETGLRVFGDGLAVDLDADAAFQDSDVASEPAVVLNWGLAFVTDGVEAASLFIVRVGVIDLGFVATVWPTALLELRVEVDSRVGARGGEDFGY